MTGEKEKRESVCEKRKRELLLTNDAVDAPRSRKVDDHTTCFFDALFLIRVGRGVRLGGRGKVKMSEEKRERKER